MCLGWVQSLLSLDFMTQHIQKVQKCCGWSRCCVGFVVCLGRRIIVNDPRALEQTYALFKKLQSLLFLRKFLGSIVSGYHWIFEDGTTGTWAFHHELQVVWSTNQDLICAQDHSISKRNLFTGDLAPEGTYKLNKWRLVYILPISLVCQPQL